MAMVISIFSDVLKCFFLKNLFAPNSRTDKKMSSGDMVAKLPQNCEILTYFLNDVAWQSSCNNYLLHTICQAQSFLIQDT